MFLILYYICLGYMIFYAASPKRSKVGRILAISVILISFVIPYGQYLAIGWGVLCWSDAIAHAKSGG